METAGELAPPLRILLGPGPSNVHPRVLQALSTPLVGHLDPEFIRLMEETKELLRFVFQTKNALTFPISGTGSSGMEACFVNLLEPGDEAVVGVNGVFGTRMKDVVERCGATPVVIETEWGHVFTPDQVREALSRCRRPNSLLSCMQKRPLVRGNHSKRWPQLSITLERYSSLMQSRP
jgi:alanine-glyoxylate transaminase/serine-glyoxylate transaminase/serine-pyruvate transaminase